MIRRPPRSTLFPYTDALPIYEREREELPPLCALGREFDRAREGFSRFLVTTGAKLRDAEVERRGGEARGELDRKSTRLNSSHGYISYAVFCLKKKKEEI